MAYDIEALQRTINSKWRTWSASQRKEAERMYAQAVEANAKEEAETARKKRTERFVYTANCRDYRWHWIISLWNLFGYPWRHGRRVE